MNALIGKVESIQFDAAYGAYVKFFTAIYDDHPVTPYIRMITDSRFEEHYVFWEFQGERIKKNAFTVGIAVAKDGSMSVFSEDQFRQERDYHYEEISGTTAVEEYSIRTEEMPCKVMTNDKDHIKNMVTKALAMSRDFYSDPENFITEPWLMSNAVEM